MSLKPTSVRRLAVLSKLLDHIRNRHQAIELPNKIVMCRYCNSSWPCEEASLVSQYDGPSGSDGMRVYTETIEERDARRKASAAKIQTAMPWQDR